MNNKGFTIIEVLTVLVVISLLTITISSIINTTLATSKEESYELMKKSIISASYSYINECTAKTIECDFSYTTNNTFYAEKLKQYGYLQKLKSPIDGAYLGTCILIKVTQDNGLPVVNIEDKCY